MIHKILKSIFVATLLTICAISAEAAEKAIGSVSAISGEAYAMNEDGSRVDLALKSPIFQNQTVVTGQDGKVQIIFIDNSIFTISANTELLIDEYVYNDETQQGKSIMNATKGVFKFVTGKIAKNNREEVKVNTPFATIGVRGSGGIIAVDPIAGTRVGLTQCCLDVQTPGGSIPVALDQMGTFIEVQDPDQPAPQPKPVDAAFSRIIQENFNAGFGQDDGSENPLELNNEQANNDGASQKQDRKEERSAERKERNQEPREARREQRPQQKPRLVEGEVKPIDPASQPVNQQQVSFDGKIDETQPAPAPTTQQPVVNNTITSSLVDLAAVNQDQADDEATGGANLSTNATHMGRFVRKNTGGSIVEGTISGRFLSDGRFVATVTDEGRTFNAIFPLENDGFGGRPSVVIDGTEFNIRYFKHPNEEFFVLNLEDVNGTDNIAVFAGQPYGGMLPTNGVATYGFVPNFTNSNIHEQNQFSGVLYNDYLSRNFIGGNLDTHVDGNGNVVIDGFSAVFGDITSDDQAGTIANYDFTGAAGLENGTVNSADYYGSGGTPAGVVFDTTMGSNPSIDSFAQRPNNHDAHKAIAEQNHGPVTHTGFAGGFVSMDGGAYIEEAYSDVAGGSVNEGVSIQVNPNLNYINASMEANVGGVAITPISYSTAGMGDGEVLHTTAYAAEHFGGNDGVIVSDVIADPQFRCLDCDYVHWGIWAGDIGDVGGSVGNEYAKGIKYVAGQMATGIELNTLSTLAGAQPSLQSVDYDGKTVGTILQGSNLTHHIGDFGANVNFQTRTVNVDTFTLGDYSLTGGAATWAANDQAFTGALSVDNGAGSSMSGNINGAFFGSSAEDIGGNYILNGTGVEASGIYLGSQD